MGVHRTGETEQRVLVSSLGTADYRRELYSLQENPQNQYETRFACAATARLCMPEGGRALLLLTERAENKWGSEIREELKRGGLGVALARVPDVGEKAELYEPLRVMAEHVPGGARVILDVTYGFRHLPFLYLASLAYLTGLANVKVVGIRYGAFEAKRPDGAVPLMDLTGLYRLLEWYRAVARARETGDWRAVGQAIRHDVGILFQPPLARRDIGKKLSPVRDAVEKLARALALGLPLEAGLAAARAREELDRLREDYRAISAPLRLVLNLVKGELKDLATPSGIRQKSALALSREELQRQVRLAGFYARREDAQKALLVLREVMVSAAVLGGSGASAGAEWLDYERVRRPAEVRLNAASERARTGEATEDEKAIAALWDRVREHRNRLAHAGMTVEHVRAATAKELEEMASELERLLSRGAFGALAPADGETVLLTPLGLSPGVLYSALLHTRPNRVLVLTSRQAATEAQEAVMRAGYTPISGTNAEGRAYSSTPGGYPPLRLQIVTVEDPWKTTHLPEDTREKLLQGVRAARELIVNITGGTSLLQYHIEWAARQAEAAGIACRRIALIDRRDPASQRAEPWVAAEMVDLSRGPKQEK